jgi:DNA-binding Lrp family transcriptional regulator
MTRTRPPGRHLDSRTALDYLEQMLPSDAQREVEEHLGLPCPQCHERVRELGRMIEHMRLDRAPEPPLAVQARALAVFVSAPASSVARQVVEQLARLLFDSWAEPLPAAVRRAVGDARRMRFAIGEEALEMECEIETAGAVALRGRLEASDPAIYRIEVTVGDERLSASPDARGAFALEQVPRGVARVLVVGPGAHFRLPPLTF